MMWLFLIIYIIGLIVCVIIAGYKEDPELACLVPLWPTLLPVLIF